MTEPASSNVVDMPDRGTVDHAKALADGLSVINRWRRILALRWLCVIALVVACVVWVIAVSDPVMWRIIAAGGYSVGVLAPVFMLYYFTGRTD